MARHIRSMRDAMRIYGKSRSTIYRLIDAGVIPEPFKVGGMNGWYSDELDEALDSLSSNSTRSAA